jgi:hypothetical protein
MYLKLHLFEPALLHHYLQQDHFLVANCKNLTTLHGEYHQSNFNWPSMIYGIHLNLRVKRSWKMWSCCHPSPIQMLCHIMISMGMRSPIVKDIPDCFPPQKKYSGKDILSCRLCGEEIALKDMQKHVGGHILHNICGSCGLDGCITQLLAKRVVASPSHQTANTTMFRCNTDQQLSFLILVNALMFQSTVLYAPPQFQKHHKISGNIMLFFT